MLELKQKPPCLALISISKTEHQCILPDYVFCFFPLKLGQDTRPTSEFLGVWLLPASCHTWCNSQHYNGLQLLPALGPLFLLILSLGCSFSHFPIESMTSSSVTPLWRLWLCQPVSPDCLIVPDQSSLILTVLIMCNYSPNLCFLILGLFVSFAVEVKFIWNQIISSVHFVHLTLLLMLYSHHFYPVPRHLCTRENPTPFCNHPWQLPIISGLLRRSA